MSDEPGRTGRFTPARLRAPEWLVGAAGLVLLVDLFAVHWYRGAGSLTGWQALSVLRWLLAVAGLGGLALAILQAGRRAPALPMAVTVILTVLGLLSLVALLLRELDPPGSLHRAAGVHVGLAATAVLAAAAVASMRAEGILDRDGPGEIPTLAI